MNGVISGRVVDASGAPVPGARVALSSSSAPVSDIAALTDAGGNFRRGGLAPGAYTLQVHKTGQPPRTVPVDVADGQQVNLEVRLGDPDNGNESSGVLAVELQTDLIDWSRVRLVRVALDYPGSGRSDATGKDYLLTPGNRNAAPWQVPLNDLSQSTYTYEIEYFMTDGSRKSVHATDASEQTLVLDPSQ
jgi:hypothetical protein